MSFHKETILCPVAQKSQDDPDAPALLWEGKSLSYRQLHKKITSQEKLLLNHVIRQGTPVAITPKPCATTIIKLFALWRIGATISLNSPRTPKTQHLKFIRKLRTTSSNRSSWKGKGPRLFLNDFSTIMFTSASTGQAKAVVHSIGNHFFNALGSNKNIPVQRGDRWLLSLPLYHVSGLSILWRCFIGGGAVVIPHQLHSFNQIILDHSFTHISLVATQLRRLMSNAKNGQALKKLKVILLGGGPISEDLILIAKKQKFPLFLTYGLTEMASQVATSARPRSRIVRVLKNRELKIDASGEILVRGKTLFNGYLRNGRIITSRDRQGWFHTGDWGTMDKHRGLRVIGRKDNMFISGGENIFPEEIEKAILSTHLVDLAIVVPIPHVAFGQRPIAFIQSRNTMRISSTKLKRRLAPILAAFKIPDMFYYFPKRLSSTGLKINRQHITRWTKDKKQLKKLEVI